MNVNKAIISLLAASILFVSLEVNAQKSILVPISMKHMDTPNNGNKVQAHIEIVFSEPLEGASILSDSDNAIADKSKPSTSTSIHAKGIAVASAGKYAKQVAVIHPDFQTCVVDFASLGFTDNIQAGEHYLINIEVPGLPLVEANRAFDDLDFNRAKELYYDCMPTLNAQEIALVKQRLSIIDQLESPCKFLLTNRNVVDKKTVFKCMKAQEMIYDKTRSLKAYREYLDWRKKLFGDINKNVDLEGGVSELNITKVYLDNNDTRAKSDIDLPKVDGKPYYSWIIVNTDLDDVIFKGGQQFKDAEYKEGAWRLYVSPGDGATDGLVMYHSDCVPLPISFKEHGIPEVKSGCVYSVDIWTPSAAIIEADRAFGNLEFATAQMLYNDINLNFETEDSINRCIALKRYHDVTPLVNDSVKKRWDELKKTINLKNGPIKLNDLCNKCIEMAVIADNLASKNVPGMKKNAEVYRRLAEDYQTSIMLTIKATQMNSNKEIQLDKNGNPKPFNETDVILVFDKSKLKYGNEVSMSAISKGVFKKYLPKNVSEWLIHHPGQDLKVTPMQYVWKGGNRKLQQIGDDFDISIDKGDSNFSINLFWQSKDK